MEERKEVYKFYQNKKVLLITNSNFKYHTSNLRVLDDCVVFLDNRGSQIMLAFDEIKFIEESK